MPGQENLLQENLLNIHGETGNPDESDERAALALVTAGALVALADRRIDPAERKEVLRYITDRRLAPNVEAPRLARLFDARVRRLEQVDFANVVIDALRPVAEPFLAAGVIELSERVAAADHRVHPYELQAIKFLRLITSLSRSKLARSSQGAASPA